MPQSKYIQNSFNGGEATPLMYGRTDLARYFTSLAACQNFIPTIYGPVYRRPGRRYIVDAMGPSRLIEFAVSTTQPYLLELGDGKMRFYRPGGQIQSSPGVPVEISTPWNTPADDLWDIKFVQQNDVMYLVHPNHPLMRLNRTDDATWTLTQPALHAPPTDQFPTDVSNGTITMTPTAVSGVTTFTASAPVFIKGDIGKAIISGQGRGFITALSGATIVDGTTGATLYPIATVDISDPFISTAVIPAGNWFLFGAPQSYFALGAVVGGNWQSSSKLGVGGVQEADTWEQFPVTGNPPPTPMDSFRTMDVGRYITAGGAVMKIKTVTTSTQVQVQLFTTVVDTFTTATGNIRAMPISGGAWTLEDPAFTAARGYPRSIAFLGSRLYLGGSNKLATTVFGSVVGDYENFSKGSLDNSAVEFTEDSGQFDTILWMTPYQGQLVTGNIAGEWAIGSGGGVGGNSTIITPSNVNSLIQSLYGADRIQPILVESQLLYVQHNKTRILEFSFSIYSSVFASREMNLYSGVMNTSGFKEIKYAQNPDRLVWVTCYDGELLAMTYKKDDDVWGWSRHPSTSPVLDAVISTGIMPSADNLTDDVWFVVKRATDHGAGTVYSYFIEKLDPDLNTDAGTKTDLGSLQTSISGVAYLAGRRVNIVGDGAYLGSPVVPPSGIVELPSPSRIVEVGVPYTSLLQSLNAEVKGGLNTQGYLKRFAKLWARLQNTVGVKINGKRVPFRAPSDLMDQAVPQQTFDADVMNLGSDRQGVWTVTQDQPLPCTVVAVFGDLLIGEN